PFTAATIDKALPVLPLVASTMVSPGLSRPSRSARSIMYLAMRALIEPDGLRNSILAEMPSTDSNGVSPIASRMVSDTVAKRALISTGPVCVLHHVQRQRGVRIGTAGAHLGGHPDRLHYLLLRRALLQRLGGMALDAIRALRRVGHRHRDQLLGDIRQRAVGKHRGAQRLERLQRLRRQFAALACQLDGRRGIHRRFHDSTPDLNKDHHACLTRSPSLPRHGALGACEENRFLCNGT